MANGRCDRHGGKTPKGLANPNFVDGRTSRYQYLPPALIPRFENLNADALDKLEESIAIQHTLETEVMERMTTGESAHAWQELKGPHPRDGGLHLRPRNPPTELDPGDFHRIAKPTAFDVISEIVREGAKSFAAQKEYRKELQTSGEHTRKMTEGLIKARKEVQETYTQEQWFEFMNKVLLVAKKVMSRDQLTEFATEIQVLQAQPAQLKS
jgi:hypothetical protein